MALDAATAQELITKLADEREKYLSTLNKAHEVLAQALNAAAAASSPSQALTTDRLRRNTGNTLATTIDIESVTKNADSTFSADDESDTDDDESLFVQQTLPSESYDEEGFRKHIKDYAWTEAGKAILGNVIGNEQILQQKAIFPTKLGEVEDRSHLSHYSILNGTDSRRIPVIYHGIFGEQ